ncbi:helix-turn-helix transcriptional regulator [Catenulispora sp. NF23]|uniref:winged helix-turn-helix transcriptional regulator n=1 Tax=Catenulispora pinistramenti TaxID=2705254 RepID=UPI001BAA366A|nr:helix-turn-helix domain-containing protein [Catenulispora pinistramenti]MBS2535930.1 helix-turn-helix transcriptional regulator [Catenulispora pinistramenti]
MQRTNFSSQLAACSIARTLDVIGEPWSPLILRDVWVGLRRFDQIQADLGISRKVLTERLTYLVEEGIMERLPYDQRPRYEYHLTQKGTELVDLLMVMTAWGDRWLAGEAGPPVLYRHHACGEISHVDLRCAHCGEPMHAGDVDALAGPGAAGPESAGREPAEAEPAGAEPADQLA